MAVQGLFTDSTRR